jgi:predicted kinase|nr:MAG TPA: Zeta toxin [Bacteriophage sp.]
METFDDLKLDRYVNKALLEKSLGRPEMYDGLLEIAKAQQGVYVNNAVNRKLGIVGQPYKKRKATEEEKADLTKTTEDLYKEGGVWKRDRQIKVHNKVKSEYRKKMLFETKPRAYLMLGGGGSGKGYYLKKMKEKDPSIDKLPVIDVDDMRDMIPDYERVKGIDPKKAASYVHEEVSDIGKQIDKEYLHKKSSFVKDAVFGNPAKLEKLVDELKAQGYDVHLVGVATDFDTALDRIQKRFERTKRYVPTEIARKGHKGASESFKKVIETPLKDKFKSVKLYDGNSDNGVIYDNKVLNQKELDRFLKKIDL